MIEYVDDKQVEQFKYIASKVIKLTQRPTIEELLTLYSLYKQATIGDNRTPVPSIFNQKAKVKWNAWSNQKGKSKNIARQEYIDFSQTLLEKYI